jgi:hypothetical protein
MREPGDRAKKGIGTHVGRLSFSPRSSSVARCHLLRVASPSTCAYRTRLYLQPRIRQPSARRRQGLSRDRPCVFPRLHSARHVRLAGELERDRERDTVFDGLRCTLDARAVGMKASASGRGCDAMGFAPAECGTRGRTRGGDCTESGCTGRACEYVRPRLAAVLNGRRRGPRE